MITREQLEAGAAKAKREVDDRRRATFDRRWGSFNKCARCGARLMAGEISPAGQHIRAACFGDVIHVGYTKQEK